MVLKQDKETNGGETERWGRGGLKKDAGETKGYGLGLVGSDFSHEETGTGMGASDFDYGICVKKH